MRGVEGLLEAGEISRAAAAVWGTTGLASAEEVMAKLEQVQKQGATQEAKGERHAAAS